jgi:hypothetical protein
MSTARTETVAIREKGRGDQKRDVLKRAERGEVIEDKTITSETIGDEATTSGGQRQAGRQLCCID